MEQRPDQSYYWVDHTDRLQYKKVARRDPPGLSLGIRTGGGEYERAANPGEA